MRHDDAQRCAGTPGSALEPGAPAGDAAAATRLRCGGCGASCPNRALTGVHNSLKTKMPSQLQPQRARMPVMAGHTITASATHRHEAFACEQRLNMSTHHWRHVRAMRVRVGDGRGPKRAAPKTDERGEVL